MKRLLLFALLLASTTFAQKIDYGSRVEDETFVVDVWTYDSPGSPVAPNSPFEVEDIRIYKGVSTDEKTTTNGLTMFSPFDAIVGYHLLAIDTGNDTGDSGFWTVGSSYRVVLKPDETVDGQAVGTTFAYFSIEARAANVVSIDADAVAAIVSGILEAAIDGSIDFENAILRILSVVANPFDASGDDPMVFDYRNAADDATVITHTINEDVTERAISTP